ncbi:hypothetical protein RhiirA1_470836 [Rhizophagus irregularis]|uniref:F-box domain-containing protein n=1 Tax=Rhizophagus irregularis TaxID=588596 RepID=A0A2N0R5E2_9GLOM|nr:hypothetical protein RhiirA1_470836 [Rhizophagus irregularis]
MVNRLWCETVVPVLWRNPWSYSSINYSNRSCLFSIIIYYLFDDIKELQGIKSFLSMHPLLFDYLSFCRSINVCTINEIICTGTSLSNNRLIIQQKFYGLLMRKCPELKYFDMRSISNSFPEDKTRLETICELNCDTSIDSIYFDELSRFCQHIQRLIIVNNRNPLHGIIKLIEVQKNLKYFEWENDRSGEGPYELVFRALEKKANNLNYLKLFIGCVKDFEYTLLQKILPKFHKLKTLVIDVIGNDKSRFPIVPHHLENLSIQRNSLNVLSSIIENSGGHLKKIAFRPYVLCKSDDNFNNFIRKVYENCPSIEYLTISFSPLEENFTEFEKLLKICKNLKSLLLDINQPTCGKNWKYGGKLLRLLIKSAPTNLKEIRIHNGYSFSFNSLKKFLGKWKNRPALSILIFDTWQSTYMGEYYINLINRYKSNGIIKDFKNVRNDFFYKL